MPSTYLEWEKEQRLLVAVNPWPRQERAMVVARTTRTIGRSRGVMATIQKTDGIAGGMEVGAEVQTGSATSHPGGGEMSGDKATAIEHRGWTTETITEDTAVIALIGRMVVANDG